MESTEPEQGDGLGRSLWSVAVVGVTLALLSPFAFGKATMLGVAIGAALAVANLYAIALIVRGFMRGAGLPWGVFGAFKFAALLFVIFIVLKNGWADVMPLVLGYASLPLGVVVAQLGRSAPSRQKV